MAEAVLEIVLKNLSSLIGKEISLFLGIDQDLESLSSLLTAVKATLEDAEERQFTERAVKDWLLKLKDAACVLDDILDECATQALELKYRGSSDKVHQISCFSSFHPKHVAFRYKIAKKMKRIRERLAEIAKEKNELHLTEIVRERRNAVVDWRETTSEINEPQVYGRDEDKDKIIDFLVGHADGDLSVYPIVGLGGLGKTTLAQLIFNHEMIVNHFELRIWVCVSEDFSLKRMTKAIIESATDHACEDLALQPLQKKLINLLERKRYLLVLDDVWDDKQENWRSLRSVLSHGGKGASVLVTTRLPKVAEIMGTMPAYDLSVLSDNDCWELFKQRAFGPNEEERLELVVIGKEIIKKCGGVPLAAIALGSLLRFKREEKEWLYVKESKLWSLQGENYVMPALRLSYLNLPIKLRQCFAFCAIFPKDKIISKEYLIELWVASGLISSNDLLETEDTGNEVWNELHWRSLFQDIERDGSGKITRFKMHDLVHDLAQSVAVDICCITDDIFLPCMLERIHHLSICTWKYSMHDNSIMLHKVKSLKTFITTDGFFPANILKCYSLRVLQFNGRTGLSSIGHLKLLRYLDLSFGEFKVLPESLCTLWNLQILKLNYCDKLRELPNSLIRLKSLEHLYLDRCRSLSTLPPQIRMLTSLKTLTLYVVGKKRGFLLEELRQLNLKGNLYIKHLERVKSIMDVKEANMSSKHLNKLKLSWHINEESQLQKNVEEILEALEPHTQQLQTFVVSGYLGACFPEWISSPSLEKLTSLKLKDCKNCLHLPYLRKLPSLKSLQLFDMSYITYLDEEESSNGHGITGGFASLESLSLERLPELIRLSKEDRENMFPHLKTLQISACPKFLDFPCLPSLQGMHISGECNEDLLSSIHKLSSLKSLFLVKNDELTCFPDGMFRNLISLKILEIYFLTKLEKIPPDMINLHTLEDLRISSCYSLESLTGEVLQGFHSLKTLTVANCEKFNFNLSTSFQYLTTLEVLDIWSCPKIETLDEVLQHMASLQSLILIDLPNLVSLPDWLGNLGLLRSINISGCPKLMCFPASIPDLKKLEIFGCSELEKRCQKVTGEDWPKIAHVPDVIIKSYSDVFGKKNTI